MHRARIAFAVLAIATLAASDRYVAPPPTGDDSHAGSAAAPWATIGHALAASAGGERIFLQSGGRWREPGGSVAGGRQLLPWGGGAAPEITAAVVVPATGTWIGNANVRTGAYGIQPLACYVNGQFIHLARYPDSGFLRSDQGSTAYLIKDAQLPARSAGYWTGAQVRWRRWSWWWETRPITADNGTDQLSLGGTPAVDSTSTGYAAGNSPDDQGSGYFIDNSLKALDAPGEWCWDGTYLYVYPPTGVDPATMTVEVVPGTTGWSCAGGSITGVAFRRFGGTALSIDQPSTIDGCTVEQVEDTAIALSWNAAPSAVRNCTIRDARNVGIAWNENPAGAGGSVVERNLLHRIGMDPGYGGSGSWHAAGIIMGNAASGTVRLNRIIDTGYAGVIVGHDGQTVSRNVFARCMGTLNDGAAVYTNCNATTISENIILDTIGDLSTSQAWWPLGHGIWPEFLSQFHDSIISDNTVYGSNGDGILLPNNFHCTVTGNVLVDNRSAGLDLDIANGDHTAQHHSISGNTLATVVPTRRIARSEHLNTWWLAPYTPPLPNALSFATATDFGSMAATTFIAPASGSDVIVRSDGASWTDLAAWAAANPPWAVASDRVVRKNPVLLFNDTEGAVAMTVPAGSWTLPDGSAVGATVTVQPFRSVVLVTAAAVAASPPYLSASGIDWRSATPVGAAPVLAVRRGGLGILAGGGDAVSGTVQGTAKALSYDLANTGVASLTFPASATVGSLANCSAAITTQPSGSVAAGATASGGLAATVTPAAAGAWSCVLTVASNDPLHGSYAWTASGTATATATPIARVALGGTTIVNGGTGTVSGLVAGSASPVAFTVANDGAASLAVSAATVSASSGATATVTTQATGTIAPGASASLVLTVTPTAAGAWSATLGFPSNDPAGNPYTWTVSGLANPAGASPGSTGAGGGGGCGVGGLAALLVLAIARLGLRARDPRAPRRPGRRPRRSRD